MVKGKRVDMECLGNTPFRMAAFPDFMAKADMLAMTSGRASKIMRSTPMGQVTRVRVRPSSRRVRRVILFTRDGIHEPLLEKAMVMTSRAASKLLLLKIDSSKC